MSDRDDQGRRDLSRDEGLRDREDGRRFARPEFRDEARERDQDPRSGHRRSWADEERSGAGRADYGHDGATGYGQMAQGSSDRAEGGFGYSGGYGDQGYGAPSGKAGYGPLSQGSTYGQAGAQYGRTGWGSASPGQTRYRGPEDSREAGPGQGGGSYGQQDFGPGARRSSFRDDQNYGRPAQQGAEPNAGHEHHHEPAYLHWRDRQLDSHDQDYARWRSEQARKYDEEYHGWRSQRHEAFSKDFHDWRSKQAGAGQTAPTPTAAATSSERTGVAGTTPLTEETVQVESVTDGHTTPRHEQGGAADKAH